MIYNNNAECEIIFLRSSLFNRTGRKLFTANKGDVIHSSDDTLIKVHHIGKHGEVHYMAYADGARGRIGNEPYINFYGKIYDCYPASIGEKEWLENWIKKEEMSYKSRMKCDVRHIISCGLCHQMFNCPYDKEDKRVVFTKEYTEKND